MSEDLARVPRGEKAFSPVWIQLGHGDSVNVSQGPLAFAGGVRRLLAEYGQHGGLHGSWARLLTPHQRLIAAWWRPASEGAWFPHWYATNQVLDVMRGDNVDAGLIAMIEMAMNGDFARAAAEELG